VIGTAYGDIKFAAPGVRGDIRTNFLAIDNKGSEILFLNNSMIWMSITDVWSDAGQINVYSEFLFLNQNRDSYVDCFYKANNTDFAHSNYGTCDSIYACSGDTVQVFINNDYNYFPSYFVGDTSVMQHNPYMRLVDNCVEVVSGENQLWYYIQHAILWFGICLHDRHCWGRLEWDHVVFFGQYISYFIRWVF
jgi:hypothetical protein